MARYFIITTTSATFSCRSRAKPISVKIKFDHFHEYWLSGLKGPGVDIVTPACYYRTKLAQLYSLNCVI